MLRKLRRLPRPSCSRKRFIMLPERGGSCSSLRGCNRASPSWVRIPCWAVRARGQAMLLHNCANDCGWLRPRTAPQPARFVWIFGYCRQALRTGGLARQPTRRKGSSLANSSSRMEPGTLVAGGCLAMPAAFEAGASALAGLVLSCQSPKVGVGSNWLQQACTGIKMGTHK